MIGCLTAATATAQTPADSTEYWEGEYLKFKANNRHTEAVAAARHWARLDTVTTRPYVELAQAYYTKGNIDQSEKAYQVALNRDSANTALMYQIARFYQNNGNDPKALKMYELLLKTDSTNAFYYRRGAIHSISINHTWNACSWHVRSIELEPQEIENYLAFAETQLEMRAFVNADTLLRKALEMEPTNTRAILLSAKSAYVANDYEDVIRLLEPRFPERIGSATAARYYGISLYKAGRYDDALTVLSLLAQLAPDENYPYYYMGLCLKELGNMEAAKVNFETAIEKVSTSNLSAYHEALGLLQQSEENHAEAIKHLRMAQSLLNNNELIYHLAVSYDSYYSDKSIAKKSFEKYAMIADTAENPKYKYSLERLETLKREAHFDPESGE